MIALIAVFAGWLMIGVGYATPLGGHPINTIVFLSGFGLSFSGFVYFVWTMFSKT
jgi:hypothetical protein